MIQSNQNSIAPTFMLGTKRNKTIPALAKIIFIIWLKPIFFSFIVPRSKGRGYVLSLRRTALMLVIFFLLTNSGCSVYETFVNISRLKFKLGNVNGFTLSGVDLTNKKKIGDFSPVELLRISSDFASGKLPVSFVLNVEANNPNDGKGGYPKTNATLKSFPWRLAIDDKETISGNIGSPVSVPGTGEATVIPLTMGLDLMQFFRDKGYESILNLALNIGGYSGSTSKLTLFAKPTVSTSIGNITYPEEIKIVDFQYSN